MKDLKEIIMDEESIFIAGHVRPDGDCVGACIAVYHYLHNAYPEKKIDVYLELLPDNFAFLDQDKSIIGNVTSDEKYDMFISLDCSSTDLERQRKCSTIQKRQFVWTIMSVIKATQESVL